VHFSEFRLCGVHFWKPTLQLDDKTAAVGKGVLEEFEIGTQLGTFPIPLGASGWAAMEIWKQVSSEPSRYFGATDVSEPLKILGDPGRENEDYIDAIFEMIEFFISCLRN
jgi:Sir2- and TIR-associating SLOG family